METTKRKILSLTAVLALTLCACAETPDGVKEKTENSQTLENVDNEITRVSVSELNDNSKTVSEYIEENGYSNKFILSDGVNVNSVSGLYNLTLTQVTDNDEYFPQIYEAYFGGDFTADSGYDSISDLPLQTKNEDKTLEFVYNDEAIIGGVQYTDLNTYYEEYDTYKTYLDVDQTGFLYYEKNHTFFDNEELVETVRFDRNGYTDTEYTMTNGEAYSLTTAKEYVEKSANEVYGIFDDSFDYIVQSAQVYNIGDDKNYFYFSIQKEYCGVPFLNAEPTAVYGDDEPRNKNMSYDAIIYEPDTLTETDAPYGFEEIYSLSEITDDVIPLTSAVDLLNKELAANIRLEISDIKLMYFNEYDAADVAEYEKLWERKLAGEEVTLTEEQKLSSYDYLTPGREYLPQVPC